MKFTFFIGAIAAVGAMFLATPESNAEPVNVQIVTKIGNCPANKEIRTSRIGRIMGDVPSNVKAGGGGGIDGNGHNTTGDAGSPGGVTYTRQETRTITYVTITCNK